jgi:hypothetical protein
MNAFNAEVMEKLKEIQKIHEARTPEEKAFWDAEWKKCKESPLYYYNNYWRKEGDPELTQKQFDAHVAKYEATMKKNRFQERFNLLPDFIKK